MYFIGIDPGQSGAIAMLNETSQIISLIDWPGDESGAAKILLKPYYHNNVNREYKAVIESVHAMPRQGVSSTFKFGKNFGIWLGILAAYGISYELVTPQKWQKGVIKKADGKKASLIAARRKWPKAELHLAKHHGRADALWIAEWLRLKYCTGNVVKT